MSTSGRAAAFRYSRIAASAAVCSPRVVSISAIRPQAEARVGVQAHDFTKRCDRTGQSATCPQNEGLFLMYRKPVAASGNQAVEQFDGDRKSTRLNSSH